MKYDKLIFELSKPGKIGHKLPELDVEDVCIKELIPAELLNDGEIDLPEVSEPEVVRHFVNLSNTIQKSTKLCVLFQVLQHFIQIFLNVELKVLYN